MEKWRPSPTGPGTRRTGPWRATAWMPAEFGGSTAYSAATDSGWIEVTDINDAPVLAPQSPAMGTTDVVTPLKITLNQFVARDHRYRPQRGDRRGRDYRRDGTGDLVVLAERHHVRELSGAECGLGAAAAPHRHDPLYAGRRGARERRRIAYQAWDTTQGVPGGTADVTASGGDTAFSVATDVASLTVKEVNDPPVDRRRGQSRRVHGERSAHADPGRRHGRRSGFRRLRRRPTGGGDRRRRDAQRPVADPRRERDLAGGRYRDLRQRRRRTDRQLPIEGWVLTVQFTSTGGHPSGGSGPAAIDRLRERLRESHVHRPPRPGFAHRRGRGQRHGVRDADRHGPAGERPAPRPGGRVRHVYRADADRQPDRRRPGQRHGPRGDDAHRLAGRDHAQRRSDLQQRRVFYVRASAACSTAGTRSRTRRRTVNPSRRSSASGSTCGCGRPIRRILPT